MNIILTGVKGVGKTTWGKKLAEKVQYRFIDTDQEIEAMHFKREKEHLKCREIHQNFGEIYFRTLEKEVIFSLREAKKSIIALGGGAILSSTTRRSLPELGTIICLYLDSSEIEKKWAEIPNPTFLKKGYDFQTAYKERMDKIRDLPCTWIRADSENIMEILEGIVHGQ